MPPPALPQSLPEFFSHQVRQAKRFYLDLAPPSDLPLAVVCGGREECSPDYAIHRPHFPYCSIEFVAHGAGTLTLAGQAWTLLPGMIFSYGPGVSQDIITDPAEPLVKYFVDFTGPRGVELLELYTPGLGGVGRVLAPGEIKAVFDELIGTGLKNTRFSAALCTTLLEYLILKIAESLMPGEAPQTAAFLTYQRCREHILIHCLSLKSLSQIARECHVAPAYLCRLFQQFAHQTPYQFLLRLKMNAAAERLQGPAVAVKQVATELGFSDPFHFSRAFKESLGLSPEAFRRLR